MNRSLSLFIFVLIVAAFAGAQTPRPTADEEGAASRIKLEYSRRMGETGLVDRLVDDLFITNVSTRWLQEARAKVATGSPEIKNSPGYLAAGLLTYSPRLLDNISPDDWKKLNLASTDFVRALAFAMMNRVSDLKAAGKDLDKIDDEAEIAQFFPPAVKSLLAGNPVFAAAMDHNAEPKTIETVVEANTVATVLTQGCDIYMKEFGERARRLTPLTMKALAAAPKGENDNSTRVEVSRREMYGFPAGTRFISVYASPPERLIFVKHGADYKIVDVVIEIGD